MKKLINKFYLVILLVLFSIITFSCNFKKPRVKLLAYEGSVMLYSSLNEEESQMIKESFEKACPGITLDYYFGTEDEVKNKIETEKKSNVVSADIVILRDIKWFQSSKYLLYTYEPYDARKIEKKYKDIDNCYVPVAILNGSSEKNPSFLYTAVIKGSLSENNATYLVDYLLSDDGQEILKNFGFLSVNTKSN